MFFKSKNGLWKPSRRGLLLGAAGGVFAPYVARADGMMSLLGVETVATPVAGKSYTYIGNATWSGAGDNSGNLPFTVPAGTYTALVMIGTNSNPTSPTVTVNGVSLTDQIDNITGQTGYGASAIFTAPNVTFPGGSINVVVNWTGSGYFGRSCHLYIVSGLSSSTAAATAQIPTGTSANIAVQNGDFMFACAMSSAAETYSASTVAPNAVNSATSAGSTSSAADWQIAATNASFSVNPNTVFVAATFR